MLRSDDQRESLQMAKKGDADIDAMRGGPLEEDRTAARSRSRGRSHVPSVAIQTLRKGARDDGSALRAVVVIARDMPAIITGCPNLGGW